MYNVILSLYVEYIYILYVAIRYGISTCNALSHTDFCNLIALLLENFF